MKSVELTTKTKGDIIISLTELTLGQHLRSFRQRAAMSQLDLELSSELSPGTISRIENNVIVPTLKTLLKIVWALSLGKDEISSLFNESLYKEKARQ